MGTPGHPRSCPAWPCHGCFAAAVNPSLLPSQLGGGFQSRPLHLPLSYRYPKNIHPLPPPFRQSPTAQARTDSSITTRPPCAPSLPTTQLLLQQETALVNQCSSLLICVCQAARRGGPRAANPHPSPCPQGAGGSLDHGGVRTAVRSAGEVAGAEQSGDLWPLWDAQVTGYSSPTGLFLSCCPLPCQCQGRVQPQPQGWILSESTHTRPGPAVPRPWHGSVLVRALFPKAQQAPTPTQHPPSSQQGVSTEALHMPPGSSCFHSTLMPRGHRHHQLIRVNYCQAESSSPHCPSSANWSGITS